MQYTFLLAVTVTLQLFSSTQAGVAIEPTTKDEVVLLSSGSRILNCKLVNGVKDETTEWIDPTGNTITSDSSNRIYASGNASMMGLELKSPKKQDSGYYKCVSHKDNRETAYQMFYLYVFNPTIVSCGRAGLVNYLISEGNSVTMECLVISDNDTSVRFTWSFGQQDLSLEPAKYRIGTIPESSDNKAESRVKSFMKIQNVTREQDGNYTLKVYTSNRHLSYVKEFEMNLRVQYKPSFYPYQSTDKIIWIEEESVERGVPLTVNFTCRAKANSQARFTWFTANDTELVSQSSMLPGQRTQTVIEDSENKSILTVHYRSIGDIKNATRNSGEGNLFRYGCKAYNEQGVALKWFKVQSQSSIIKITTIASKTSIPLWVETFIPIAAQLLLFLFLGE